MAGVYLPYGNRSPQRAMKRHGSGHVWFLGDQSQDLGSVYVLAIIPADNDNEKFTQVHRYLGS